MPSLRILLVEDNNINQRLALRVLDKLGHKTTLAQHGQEACDLVQNADFDLILMDIQMPVMDGIAATRHIREWSVQNNKAHQRIVAMTAQALPGERERLAAEGLDGYVSKPFMMEELVDEIDMVLQRFPLN